MGFGYLLSCLFPLKWRLQAMLPAEYATYENEGRPGSPISRIEDFPEDLVHEIIDIMA